MTPLEVAWAAPVFTLIGAIVGATITATVGWFESRRRREHDRRHDDAALAERQRVAMTDRASEFLAATYHAVLAMRDVALAPDDHKREIEKREIWPTVDRVNRCLTAVKVNDSNELVAAAVAIDAALDGPLPQQTLARHEKQRRRDPQLARHQVDLPPDHGSLRAPTLRSVATLAGARCGPVLARAEFASDAYPTDRPNLALP